MDLALILGGALLAATGLHGFHLARAMIRRALPATGRVVKIEGTVDEDDSAFPVVEFTTPEGMEIRIRLSGTNRPPKIGAKVKLTYDPLHPNTAWERRSAMPFAMPTVFLLAGLGLVTWGAVLHWDLA